MSEKAKELAEMAEWLRALKVPDHWGAMCHPEKADAIAAELTRLAERVTFLEKRLARTGYCLKHDTWMHPAESCAKE